MPNPVVHFEIIGENQDLLEGFYKSIFDWKITPIMKGYSLVETGSGSGGGIGSGDEPRRHVMFYVAVASVADALTLIETKGGKKAFGPHTIPDGGIIAGFLDPEGHLVGLVQGPPGM